MDTSHSEESSVRKNSSKSKNNNVLQSKKQILRKKIQRKKVTTTKRKVKRPKVQKSDNEGLDGNYWNVSRNDRHVTKPKFDQNYFDEDDDDDSDDSLSKSKSTIRKKAHKQLGSASSNGHTTLVYLNKSFITCRSPADSFYLCQVLQDVHNLTKQIRIRWYSLADENGDETKIDENTHFKPDYEDTLDPRTILTEITQVIHHADKTISLKKQDIAETNRLLEKSIKGESISSNESIDENEETKSKVKKQKITFGEKRPIRKRRRVNSGEAAPIRKRRRTKDINDVSEGEQEVVKKKRTPKKTTTRSTVPSKAKLFKVQSNRFLKANSTITTYENEPFFEDNLPVPFISSSIQSKLAIRAVLLNDAKLLKSLINDIDHVCSVHVKRNLPNSLTAIHYAIKNNNIDILNILMEDLKTPKRDRCPFPEVTIEVQSTGNASIRTLGFRTAKIMASRGAREGNNALIKDTQETINRYSSKEILTYALENNCSREVSELIRKYFHCSDIYNYIINCIQAGHRKLAVSIIDEMAISYSYGYTKLHHEVLKFDQEDLIVESASDTITKTKDSAQITPIHCAAINPNAKYLKQLVAIVPEYSIKDKCERQPIHFAAACEGTEPLEFLLSKNVNFNDVNSNGDSPLHLAATYGRPMNIKVLLSYAKEKAESNNADDQKVHEQFGLASINLLNKSRFAPLHLAVINNNKDCVKVLLEFGANVDVFTNTTKEKLSPLMLACQQGYLDIAIYLIDHGARVEQRDRFKRTPLIHACMYGNAHIVSYLLRLGANANVFDSSMNTAIHYAIAYGWYFCVQLLVEAGANLNCVNCWQKTCLGIGFSKGHYGICDYLLTEHQADVNFKTDDGLTLVMITTQLNISAAAVQQLEYVVVKHKADCTCVNIDGKNAFHFLAQHQNQFSSNSNQTEQNDHEKYYFRMAQILIDHNCNPLQMDNKAKTPFMIALESRNFILVDFFINQAKLEINSDVSSDGKTLLHYFAMNCINERLVQILLNLPVNDEMKKMSQMADIQGRTPLHYCASCYDGYARTYYSSGNSQYESIIKMLRYCLETINCDPDLGVRPKKVGKVSSDDEIDEIESSNENVNTIEETCIFYLLRTSRYYNSTMEHPLEIFLKKTKNINVLHHTSQRTPLLEAIHLKDNKAIDILLNQPSCDINAATSILQSERQQTPLIVACKLQYFSVISILLNHPKCDLLAFDDQHNQAFHYFLAVSNRSDEYLEIFQLFIEKLKSIGKHTLSCPGKSGRTPLHIAVSNNLGTVDFPNIIEQTLIINECDLFIKDDLGNLPLHDVFLTRRNGDDPVELCVLIMQGMKYNLLDTKNNEGNTPLHVAVSKSCTVCIMLLLKHRANLLIENNLSNSAISTCIASNHLNLLITFLLQPIDIDLSKAYITSQKSIVPSNQSLNFSDENSLVSSESSSMDVETTTFETEDIKCWVWDFAPTVSTNINDEEKSLIYLIIQRNWQGALSLILEELDRFHLKHIQVFEPAIFNDKIGLVHRFLTGIKDPTILNEKNSHGRNIFHLIANLSRYDEQFSEKVLNYLINNQGEWNVPDKYGSCPLHYACIIPNKSFINFLQKKCPLELDFTQTDSSGNTAYGLLFWSAATGGSYDKNLVKTLVSSGKSIDCLCNYQNEIARNPLSFGRINSSSRLVIPYPPTQFKQNSTKNVRISPLINAIVHNNFELAKFILELGADVNFADEEKITPLMHAVRQNNIEIVKLLLNKDYPFPDKNLSKSNLPNKSNNRKPRTTAFFLGATTTSLFDNYNTNDKSDEDDNNENENSDNNKTTNEYVPFPKTSSIDMNATDTLGRTCIHYLVQPFPDASYINNIELLKLLHEADAILTKRDLTGLSPFNYSVMNGCQHLCNALAEFIKEEQMDSTEVTIKCFSINDPNKELLDLPNYYSDAQEFINQYILAHPCKTVNTAYQVDPLSNMSGTGEVVIDTNKNEPYDVRLTITDVDYGLIGLYNFYRMQIIKHKCKANLYLLFTRWGRIGDGNGQHQLTPYSTFEECRQEFCKVFREKTGNLWENTDQFQTKPKKYLLIKLDERETHRYTNVPIDFQQLQDDKQHVPSKLQSFAYKNLLRTFFNPEAIRANLRRTELDVEWMPISQLKPETLEKARDILVQLKTNIEKKEKLKLTIQQSICNQEEKEREKEKEKEEKAKLAAEKTTTDEQNENETIENAEKIAIDEQKEKEEKEAEKLINDQRKAEFKLLLDSICKLTNEYYSIIPLQGYGDEKLFMIDTEQAVKAQEQKLDDIFELELSYKILLATQANLNKMSPFDYLYKSMNCQFEAMNMKDLDSQFILRYIWASSPYTQVEQIFKIARSSDDDGRPFQPNLQNHYLLWHGTNICNLISILIRGLLVTPLCATATGSLFGKGIYTADAFGKSLGYCSGVSQDGVNRCFMLLCEVALGNSQEVNNYNDDVTAPLNTDIHQSRLANGRRIPDPRYTITRNYGVRMPLGPLINCNDPTHGYHRCEYNEYIVFDESQIALRYLVQFRR